MPAKKKYLSGSWQRFSKVTAAILASYVLTMMVHVMIIKLAPVDKPFVLTSSYTSFMMWIGLMVVAFLIEKSWHVWSLYLGLAFICAFITLI